MNKFKILVYRVALAILSLLLIVAGLGKLVGMPEMHMSFQKMGLPPMFAYGIGGWELVAGLLLPLASFRSLAAMLVIPVLLGAIYYHLVYEVHSIIPALVLLFLAIYFAITANHQSRWPLQSCLRR